MQSHPCTNRGSGFLGTKPTWKFCWWHFTSRHFLFSSQFTRRPVSRTRHLVPGSDSLSHVRKDMDSSLLVQTESHHHSVQCLPKWQRVITDFFQTGSVVLKGVYLKLKIVESKSTVGATKCLWCSHHFCDLTRIIQVQMIRPYYQFPDLPNPFSLIEYIKDCRRIKA